MDDVLHQEEETFPNHVAAMEAQTGGTHPETILIDQPEPAISPAPKPRVRRRDLETQVEDAFRFGASAVTPFQVGVHVAEGLGFEVVEGD